MQRLKAAAAKAAARAASAKEQVRAAKVLLKQARKAFKAEKKAAKQVRRKVDAASAALVQDRAVKAAVSPKSPLRGATTNVGRGAVRSAVRGARRYHSFEFAWRARAIDANGSAAPRRYCWT